MNKSESNEMATLQKVSMEVAGMAGYLAGLCSSINEQMGKIEAKKKLKLPLTQKERAIWTLFKTQK